MKRTGVVALLLLAAVGFALAIAGQFALASAGQTGLVPPVSLSLALGVIGVLVVIFAVPIRRAVKGARPKRVDHDYAVRVLVLAKSSALAGALLGGAALGLIVYLLTRSVPALGSVGYSIGMAVGAVLLLAGGLIAEEMCRIPPGDDEDDDTETAHALP